MKPMQGNSMGKLCFSTFVLENKKISFSFLLAFLLLFLFTCTRYVSVQRWQAILLIYLIKHFLFLKKNWATGEQGYKVARWGKETKGEREHSEKRLIHETRFFLSLFFPRQSGWVCVQISKRQNKQNNYGRLLWGLSIYKVSLGRRSFCDRSGCAHNRRTLEKKINVAIILLLRNACLISVTMLYV